MIILQILAALTALIACCSGYLKYVHIFQLHSYKMPEQLKWTASNTDRLLPHFIALLFAVTGIFVHNAVFLLAESCFFLLAAWAVRPPKKAKKPLVFTARIKRLTVTAAILTLLLLVPAALIREPHIRYGDIPDSPVPKPVIQYVLPGLAFFLVPLLPVIANVINQPVEKGIQKHFIHDAQRMLRECPNLTVIGITGSYGKTSVKYFLNTLLTAKYNVLMTPASFNTPMGVVRTIREQLRPTHEIFICEMGARRNGEIQELCDIVDPDLGILTSIGPQHLETFRTIETIIDTKFALARSVAKKGRGVCFVNADNPYIRENMGKIGCCIPYGTTPDCAYSASDMTVTHEGTRFVIRTKDGEVIDSLQTSLVGMHNAVNLAGAIGMALHLGVTPQQIRVSLARIAAPPHRLELKRNGSVTILDDAYNANPSGSKAALDALAMFPDCKILVTPGMVELGAEQELRNTEFGRQAAAVCDYIFLVGEKQAVPIRKGIEEAGFDMSRVTVTHTVEEAISGAYAVQTAGRKVILLENDLPDNYL